MVDNILERFDMQDCHPVATPLAVGTVYSKADCPTSDIEKEQMKSYPYRTLIGMLMYLMLATRPDLAYSVSYLSQFLDNPGIIHWEGAKRVIRYLKGTKSFGIYYKCSGKMKFTPQGLASTSFITTRPPTIEGMTDSDYAADIDDRVSRTGYVFTMSNGAISWKSVKQRTVTLSSTEAEYYAMSHAGREAVWIKILLTELGFGPSIPIMLRGDNQGALALLKNPVHHGRTKHIAIHHHWIREHIANGDFDTEYVNTKRNYSDIMTKALPRDPHAEHRTSMGMITKSEFNSYDVLNEGKY